MAGGKGPERATSAGCCSPRVSQTQGHARHSRQERGQILLARALPPEHGVKAVAAGYQAIWMPNLLLRCGSPKRSDDTHLKRGGYLQSPIESWV